MDPTKGIGLISKTAVFAYKYANEHEYIKKTYRDAKIVARHDLQLQFTHRPRFIITKTCLAEQRVFTQTKFGIKPCWYNIFEQCYAIPIFRNDKYDELTAKINSNRQTNLDTKTVCNASIGYLCSLLTAWIGMDFENRNDMDVSNLCGLFIRVGGLNTMFDKRIGHYEEQWFRSIDELIRLMIRYTIIIIKDRSQKKMYDSKLTIHVTQGNRLALGGMYEIFKNVCGASFNAVLLITRMATIAHTGDIDRWQSSTIQDIITRVKKSKDYVDIKACLDVIDLIIIKYNRYVQYDAPSDALLASQYMRISLRREELNPKDVKMINGFLCASADLNDLILYVSSFGRISKSKSFGSEVYQARNVTLTVSANNGFITAHFDIGASDYEITDLVYERVFKPDMSNEIVEKAVQNIRNGSRQDVFIAGKIVNSSSNAYEQNEHDTELQDNDYRKDYWDDNRNSTEKGINIEDGKDIKSDGFITNITDN